jgi:copper(I)-binding protein
MSHPYNKENNVKTIYANLIIVLITMTLAAAQCGGPPAAAPVEEALADESVAATAPDLKIMEPFARASRPNGAVYMRLVNKGGTADRLVGVETEVAEAAELHETRLDENDIMQMRPLDAVDVPARGLAVLEPGGMHIMLMGLRRELAAGETFELTLNFEQSGPQTIEVEVTDGVTIDHGQMEHDLEEMAEGEVGHDLKVMPESEMDHDHGHTTEEAE